MDRRLLMARLSEIQINTLRALFAPMDTQELNEAMGLLMDETYERVKKGTETNMESNLPLSPGTGEKLGQR
jgi:hypothetical protein